MTEEINLSPIFQNKLGESLGITEAMIEKLVHSFYAKIREDKLIGPIFNEIIKNDWDEHLTRICDFWSSIALSSRRYKGQPLIKHVNIPKLNKEHFLRWLSIFEETTYDICPKEAAVFFINRSKTIAKSMMYGIEFYHKNYNKAYD